MAFIPIANTVKAAIRFSVQAQTVINTLYFRADSAVTPATLAVIGTALEGWVVEELLPKLTNLVDYRDITLTDQSEDNGFQIVQNNEQGAVGSLAPGQPLPNQTAMVISFRTVQSGRSFRGRNYLAGWGINNVVGGNTFGTPFVGGVVDAYNDLLVRFNGTSSTLGATWCVVSRYANGAARLEGLATPVNRIQVTSVEVKSQRRRMPSRGV